MKVCGEWCEQSVVESNVKMQDMIVRISRSIGRVVVFWWVYVKGEWGGGGGRAGWAGGITLEPHLGKSSSCHSSFSSTPSILKRASVVATDS